MIKEPLLLALALAIALVPALAQEDSTPDSVRAPIRSKPSAGPTEVSHRLRQYAHARRQGASRPGTIAIAARGPRAGEAVFRALEAAEEISSGSIGGVAVIYAILPDGTVRTFDNSGRGGTRTLFIRGEETGVPPPPAIAEATIAGVLSTGPRSGAPPEERGPHPAYGDGVGFVVGHRIPGAVGASGLPVDHETFKLMQEGLSARQAVDRVMSANPRLDVGLIAVDAAGNVAMRNSALVDERPDYGRARGEDPELGVVVETIFNEIHPPQAVAQLVVNVALEIMTGSQEPDFEITVPLELAAERGAENVVEVDDRMQAVRVTTTDEIARGDPVAVVPYLLSRVVHDGETIGYTINEVSVLYQGKIQPISAQDEIRIRVKAQPRVCDYETPHRTVCRAL